MFIDRFLTTTGACFHRPLTVINKFHGLEAGDNIANTLTEAERRTYRGLANLRNCAGAMIGSTSGGKAGWFADQVLQHKSMSWAGLKETALYPLLGNEHATAVAPFFTSLFAAMSSVYLNHPNGGDLKGLCRDIELSVARRLANSGEWLQHTARRWITT